MCRRIRDVVCRDNHRQGISVISAENLLIENTQLLTTHGTAPQAGIDFEPNHPQEVLKNCVMRNCRASGNAGYGFFTWVGQLNSTSEPVSLRFENCVSTGDRMSFGYAGRVGTEVPATLTIEGCRFEFPKDGVAVNIRENRYSPMKVELKDSVVVTNGEADPMVSPLGANWIAENLPRTADPEGFLPRVKLDYSQLRLQDDAPGKLIEFSPLRVRHQAKYLVYAGSARELRFRGRQIQVGHYALSKQPMRVMDVKGGLVTELPIPQTTSQDFGVKVPMAGFYRVEIDSGQGAFLLEAADAQVAIDGTDGLMNLIASEGTFGFWVPEGTNRFDFWATGSGAERVTVSLFCPAGGCVWRRADLGGNACSKQRHPQSGLWFVEVARPSKGCFEDSCYDLSGLPAVFYCRPGISE